MEAVKKDGLSGGTGSEPGEFDESKHPRDGDGKFTSKGSGQSLCGSVADIPEMVKQTTLYGEEKPSGSVVNRPSIEFTSPNSKDFAASIAGARESNPPETRWRVDVHDEEGYAKDKLFMTKGGSCVAVEPDGNIVSVCKNQNSGERGAAKALLQKAVQEGGNKLDAFGRILFDVYTSNGFEPISWIPFDEQYAPEDWVKGRDETEPVIFYKYTGKKSARTCEEFTKNVPPAADYDAAKQIRDEEIK